MSLSLYTHSVATLQQYSSDLNMNSPKGRNFLRNAPYTTRMQILNDIDKYGGHPLDEQFFHDVMPPGSLDNYWDNYNLVDISKFFDGLTFDESVGAIDAFLDGPGKLKEIPAIPEGAVKQALNDKGYDIDNLTYPDHADIELDDDTLTVNNNTIDLATFTDGHNTINVEDDGTLRVNGVKVEAEA